MPRALAIVSEEDGVIRVGAVCIRALQDRRRDAAFEQQARRFRYPLLKQGGPDDCAGRAQSTRHAVQRQRGITYFAAVVEDDVGQFEQTFAAGVA